MSKGEEKVNKVKTIGYHLRLILIYRHIYTLHVTIFTKNCVVLSCVLTLGPASCGCHRKEGRIGDVLHEAAIHEDIWTTECEQKKKKWEKCGMGKTKLF